MARKRKSQVIDSGNVALQVEPDIVETESKPAKRRRKRTDALQVVPDTVTDGVSLDLTPPKNHIEEILEKALRQNLKILGDEVEDRLHSKLKVLGQFYGITIRGKILFEITSETTSE
jgi:hypothetical protein